MPERPIPHPASDEVKSPRRKFKLSDIIIVVVIIGIVAFLASLLAAQLRLKHEVASARTATDGLLADIRTQNAAAAYKFGDNAFQQKYTQQQLANLFRSLHPLIKENPTIIKQTADNGSANQVVSIYYQFDDKPSYYFAATVIRPNGTTRWQLLNFSGSPKQSDLFKVQ